MKRQEKEEKEKKEVDDNLDFHHDTDETVFPQIPSQNNTTETEQTRINIGTFARTCDRYGIPDRPAAALASALLMDMGIKDKSQSSQVFDKNKVRRERVKIRKEISSKDLDLDETNLLQALYFDGRIDKTYFIETSEDGKKHRRVHQEYHLSIIQEPGSKYVGHVKPLSGKAVDIANSIMQFMSDKQISLSELVCVGCDGCPTNTGKSNGVIRILETKLDKPLQWVVCQLHTNELPLRHLFEFLDGQTSGPHGFSGSIGKALADCHKQTPTKFEPIMSPVEELFPDLNKVDLSMDQKYLYDICKIVTKGESPPGFGDRSPGKLNHARWVTTANRVLRLYIASSSPSDQLKDLAKYVALVYAPSWFTIKCNHKLKDGSSNLWKMLDFSSYMSHEQKKVIHKCIQNNAYFAHPENMLVAMLSDDRKHIRQLAIRRILNARKKTTEKEFDFLKFLK